MQSAATHRRRRPRRPLRFSQVPCPCPAAAFPAHCPVRRFPPLWQFLPAALHPRRARYCPLPRPDTSHNPGTARRTASRSAPSKTSRSFPHLTKSHRNPAHTSVKSALQSSICRSRCARQTRSGALFRSESTYPLTPSLPCSDNGTKHGKIPATQTKALRYCPVFPHIPAAPKYVSCRPTAVCPAPSL